MFWGSECSWKMEISSLDWGKCNPSQNTRSCFNRSVLNPSTQFMYKSQEMYWTSIRNRLSTAWRELIFLIFFPTASLVLYHLKRKLPRVTPLSSMHFLTNGGGAEHTCDRDTHSSPSLFPPAVIVNNTTLLKKIERRLFTSTQTFLFTKLSVHSSIT